MGFLPKPMTASELLQFLACKTFEALNPPVPPKKGTIDSPPLQKGGEGGFKKVLIVNDDNELLITLGIILKSPERQILSARNLESAMEQLRENKIDVILSDINMGSSGDEGYELLKHVRENDQAMPFYMLSGYSRADEEPKAKAMGASGYIQLPFDQTELKNLL